MSELILHHHDPSPFAEKIRLIFGVKQLPWHSVQVAMVMPRPQMMALTGGYRKIPVLQVGADIYCDTALICREIEKRYPERPIFPGGNPGLSVALGQWSDRAFFDAGASLAMATDEVPQEVIDDRRAFFTHLDFDSFRSNVPHLLGQLSAHAALIEDSLRAGHQFLDGATPGWRDILAWFPVWMANGYVAEAEQVFHGLDSLNTWSKAMGAIGHGEREDIGTEEAVEIARAATPALDEDVSDPFAGLSAGDRVSVAPADYGKDPVTGELLKLNRAEIALRRMDPEAGEIVVHFPRIGFRVSAT